jgi:hypothetical protein
MIRARAQGIPFPTRRSAGDNPEAFGDSSMASLTNSLLPTPEAKIPPFHQASHLIEIFLKSQSYVRLLPPRQLEKNLDEIYNSPKNASPYSILIIHIAMAISILYCARKENSTSAKTLAENHFECALKQLPAVLATKNLESLQALLLVLQFMLSNPQNTIVWYLIGHALRLAVSLGLHVENGVGTTHLDKMTLDERRNVFWTLYTVDRAVGNTLGR